MIFHSSISRNISGALHLSTVHFRRASQCLERARLSLRDLKSALSTMEQEVVLQERFVGLEVSGKFRLENEDQGDEVSGGRVRRVGTLYNGFFSLQPRRYSF